MALQRETLFDLASLTKVMVTTPEILRLVEDGLVDLDDPLSRHLPEMCADDPDAAARKATIRAFLTHHASVPPLEKINLWGDDPAVLKERVIRTVWPIGSPAGKTPPCPEVTTRSPTCTSTRGAR